jgi:hypothetical protein
MPKGNEVGLSFQESILAAQAEIEGSPESASTEENELAGLYLEDEQSTDNSEDKEEGLFGSLSHDEDDDITNTPQIVDSGIVVIDGEELSLDEVKKGFMRQADYTRKTQELSVAKASVQNAVTLWDALQDDPITTLRTLNARLGNGNTSMPPINDPWQGVVARQSSVAGQGQGSQSVASSVSAAMGDVDDIVKKKVEEQLANDPRIKEYETQKAKQLLDNAFNQIEQDWGVTLSDKDKLVILEKAQQAKTTDLEMVFAALMQIVSRKKAQRSAVKQGATVSGRGFAEGDESVLPKEIPANFKEAMRAAMRELRVKNLTDLN